MLKSYVLGSFVFGIIAVTLVWDEPADAKVLTFLGGVLFWTLILSLILALH